MIGSPLPHPPHTVHPRMPSGYPWSQDPDAGPYSTATGPGPEDPALRGICSSIPPRTDGRVFSLCILESLPSPKPTAVA